MGDREIHRTGVVTKTRDPVWTIRSGSLFLLAARPEDFFSAGGLRFSVWNSTAARVDRSVGRAYLSQSELLKGTGERVGYDLYDRQDKTGRLYVRVRPADDEDVEVKIIPLRSAVAVVAAAAAAAVTFALP